MITNMISLVSKNTNVFKPIIGRIAVFMMYNMAGSKSKIFGNNQPRYALSMARLDVREAVPGLQPSIITSLRAKMMKLFADSSFCAKDFGATHGTGDRKSLLLSVNASLPEYFVNSLACLAVFLRQVLDSLKVFIRSHYVNLLVISQSSTLFHSPNPLVFEGEYTL